MLLQVHDGIRQTRVDKYWITDANVDPLHTFDSTDNPVAVHGDGPYLPRWQVSPFVLMNIVNENLVGGQSPLSNLRKASIESKAAVMGGFHSAPAGNISGPSRMTSFFAKLLMMGEGKEAEYPGDPDSHICIPIFDSLYGTNRTVVGVVESSIYWRWHLRNILPDDHEGLCVVIDDCDGSFTYHVHGSSARAVGFGDQHDRRFSGYRVDGVLHYQRINDGTMNGVDFHEISCPYTFHVYPFIADYDQYKTQGPLVISLSVAAVFLFTIGMFLVYDRLVERRQKVVLAKATQSTAIVSSLFVSSKHLSGLHVTFKRHHSFTVLSLA